MRVRFFGASAPSSGLSSFLVAKVLAPEPAY